MVIDTKKQYVYTSSAIRPLQVQEYFPLKIKQSNKSLKLSKFCPPPRTRSD